MFYYIFIVCKVDSITSSTWTAAGFDFVSLTYLKLRFLTAITLFHLLIAVINTFFSGPPNFLKPISEKRGALLPALGCWWERMGRLICWAPVSALPAKARVCWGRLCLTSYVQRSHGSQRIKLGKPRHAPDSSSFIPSRKSMSLAHIPSRRWARWRSTFSFQPLYLQVVTSKRWKAAPQGWESTDSAGRAECAGRRQIWGPMSALLLITWVPQVN